MVPLVSMAAVVWFVVQWTCSILVLLIVGALLAETSPPSSSVAGAVNDSREGGGGAQHSAGKRCDNDVLVRRDFRRFSPRQGPSGPLFDVGTQDTVALSSDKVSY